MKLVPDVVSFEAGISFSGGQGSWRQADFVISIRCWSFCSQACGSMRPRLCGTVPLDQRIASATRGGTGDHLRCHPGSLVSTKIDFCSLKSQRTDADNLSCRRNYTRIISIRTHPGFRPMGAIANAWTWLAHHSNIDLAFLTLSPHGSAGLSADFTQAAAGACTDGSPVLPKPSMPDIEGKPAD